MLTRSSMLSRVVPCMSETMALSSLSNLLSKSICRVGFTHYATGMPFYGVAQAEGFAKGRKFDSS